MRFRLTSQIVLLVFLCCLQHYSINALDRFPIRVEYYLHDLYLYGLQGTIDEMGKQWKLNGITDLSVNKSSLCGTFETLLGGYNMFRAGNIIERTYDSLPGHGVIFYYMRFFIIDQWQIDDQVQIDFDGQTVITFRPYQFSSSTSSNQCGSLTNDVEIKIVGSFIHSSSSLTIKIITSNPSHISSGYFGLSDLKMRLANKKGTDSSYSEIKLNNNPGTTITNVSQCSKGQYYNSSCKPCNTSCEECYGPSASECFGCANRLSYNFTTDTCVTCQPAGSCFLCTGPETNQCMGCFLDNNTLFWNHTCKPQSACTSPYVYYSAYCLTPCQMNNTFMFKDYTCSSSCSLPLISRMDGDAKFCDSPCAVNEYLYWNGTCKTDCSFNQRTTNGILYCDVCPQGNFMYSNNTCLPACPQPYKQRSVGTSFFCDHPCEDNKYFFYTEDSVCRPTCSYPHQIYSSIYCILTATEEQLSKVRSLATGLNTAETTSNAVGVSVGVLDYGNPASIFVNAYVDMFKKIKFMNIKYPSKVHYFFEKKVDQKFIKIPEVVKSYIEKLSLPEKFAQYKLHSSFLVNFWQEIMVVSFIILIISVCTLLKFFTKGIQVLQTICSKIEKVIKWNLSLTLFTSYFGDMVMFTSLELRTFNPVKILPILSYIICFITNIFALITLVKMVFVIFKNWKSFVKPNMAPIKSPEDETETIRKNLDNYEVTFKNYKTKYLMQQVFMVVFVTRIYIYSIVIGYLFEYPVIQTSFLTFLCLFMLLYLLLARPFKAVVDLCQFFTQELVTMTVLLSTLILSVFDHTNTEKYDIRDSLGEVILGCNIAYTAVGFFFLAVRLLLMVKDLVQKRKRGNNQVIQGSRHEIEVKSISKLDEPSEVQNRAFEPARTQIRNLTSEKIYASNLTSQFNSTPEAVQKPLINPSYHRINPSNFDSPLDMYSEGTQSQIKDITSKRIDIINNTVDSSSVLMVDNPKPKIRNEFGSSGHVSMGEISETGGEVIRGGVGSAKNEMKTIRQERIIYNTMTTPAQKIDHYHNKLRMMIQNQQR